MRRPFSCGGLAAQFVGDVGADDLVEILLGFKAQVAGAARLDSIFLDEGFGTLDAETLEVVATTLETLAQGDRMVGVVTHVAELAERVPVRFRVSRNAKTSTITREGLPAPEGPETAETEES